MDLRDVVRAFQINFYSTNLHNNEITISTFLKLGRFNMVLYHIFTYTIKVKFTDLRRQILVIRRLILYFNQDTTLIFQYALPTCGQSECKDYLKLKVKRSLKIPMEASRAPDAYKAVLTTTYQQYSIRPGRCPPPAQDFSSYDGLTFNTAYNKNKRSASHMVVQVYVLVITS